MASTATSAPLTGAQRKEKIVAVFAKMAADQVAYREHFTAFGRPSVKFLSTEVGFDVPAKEVEAFWNEFQAAK